MLERRSLAFLAISKSRPSRASVARSLQSLSVTPKQAIWWASLNSFLSRYWYIGADWRQIAAKKAEANVNAPQKWVV